MRIMPIPIIVLGAGASHDYTHYGNPPPLTDHLVNEKYLDLDIISEYREASYLISELAPQIITQNKSFEKILSSIMKSSGQHMHRKHQFIGLQFYLRDYFEKLSNNFQNINNYRTLISKINDHSNGQAHLATFNYDTLLERSIGYDRFQSSSSYINTHPYVTKLHGSHDWAFSGSKNSDRIIDEIHPVTTAYEYFKRDPNYINSIRNKGTDPYHISEISGSSERHNIFKLPAIAIPIIDKQEFLCPSRHIEMLKRNMEQTDRILVIGWKAGDSNFLDLIKDHLKEDALLTVVSKKTETAREIVDKLKEIKNFSKTEYYGGGFAEFASSSYCENFFTQEVKLV